MKGLSIGRLVRKTGQFSDMQERKGRRHSIQEQEVSTTHVVDSTLKNYGPRTFMQFIFGVGEAHLPSATPASRLIYPLSFFAVAWVVLTSFFLAYTAIVTPPIIVFFWLDPECTAIPTLPFDTILDTFFLIDIVLNFNTGVYVAGEYIDDRRQVAVLYMKGMFLFDFMTRFVRACSI